MSKLKNETPLSELPPVDWKDRTMGVAIGFSAMASSWDMPRQIVHNIPTVVEDARPYVGNKGAELLDAGLFAGSLIFVPLALVFGYMAGATITRYAGHYDKLVDAAKRDEAKAKASASGAKKATFEAS